MSTTNLKNQTIGFIEIQSGNGVPDHSATLGSTYTDVDTGIRYKNTNGSTGWALDASSGSGSTDTYVTGFTYNNANTLSIFDSTGGTLSTSINIMTGLTVNGILSATTISASSLTTSSIKIDGPTTAGYVLTADVNGNGTWQVTSSTGGTPSSRIAGGVTTSTSGNTTLSQISGLTSDSTHFVEAYVTAKSSGTTAWATYKRTLSVTTAGTTPTIRFTNSDFDYFSSNLSATTVNFAVSGVNININVSGVTNTDIQWNSAYEIVTKSTKV